MRLEVDLNGPTVRINKQQFSGFTPSILARVMLLIGSHGTFTDEICQGEKSVQRYEIAENDAYIIKLLLTSYTSKVVEAFLTVKDDAAIRQFITKYKQAEAALQTLDDGKPVKTDTKYGPVTLIKFSPTLICVTLKSPMLTIEWGWPPPLPTISDMLTFWQELPSSLLSVIKHRVFSKYGITVNGQPYDSDHDTKKTGASHDVIINGMVATVPMTQVKYLSPEFRTLLAKAVEHGVTPDSVAALE